jgi:hypothetical protein
VTVSFMSVVVVTVIVIGLLPVYILDLMIAFVLLVHHA